MKFQAKTEEQLNEESLIPEKSICDFEVLEAADKQSKKTGADMIALKLKVYYGDGFKLVNDYLMEAMPHKLLHFCEAADLMTAYTNGTLKAADCVGRAGKVEMRIDPAGEYPAKNSVKDYIGHKRAEKLKGAKPSPAEAQDDDGDSVPF